MDEYIKRESVINITAETGVWETQNRVREMPAEDVQPVKHGYWYHNTSKYISELDAYFIQACCSCCGRYSDKIDAYSQIMSNENCSHCGTRMDGDKNV